MKNKKNATLVFLFVASCAILFNACSPGFKKKIEVANKLKNDLGAKSASVAFETKAETGKGKRSMTHLTFTGINPDGWDKIGVLTASNLAAYKFVNSMSPQEISGETHVAVTLEMRDHLSYTNEFPVDELKEAEALLAITDKVIEACVKQDKKQMHDLNDQHYLPDSLLGEIYIRNELNDSIYRGKTRKPELKGIRYARAQEDGNLDMFCVMYIEKHPGMITRYGVNVDRKTKKVVYISVYTRPEQD